MSIETILTIFNTILTIGAVAGSIIAYRTGLHRTVGEIQQRVIEAQAAEYTIMKVNIKELTARLDDLERENLKLRRLLRAIIDGLKKRGIVITVRGDKLSIRDNLSETIEHIQEG